MYDISVTHSLEPSSSKPYVVLIHINYENEDFRHWVLQQQRQNPRCIYIGEKTRVTRRLKTSLLDYDQLRSIRKILLLDLLNRISYFDFQFKTVRFTDHDSAVRFRKSIYRTLKTYFENEKQKYERTQI